jgi:hypothetical protein
MLKDHLNCRLYLVGNRWDPEDVPVAVDVGVDVGAAGISGQDPIL